MARASDSLSPVAVEVVIPHAVLELMPALTESLSPVLRESLSWTLRENVARDGSSRLPASLCPCPVLREDPSLVDHDVALEFTEPVVLVYALAVVSVTESPTVSVSWDSTKRCSRPWRPRRCRAA
jgi:hypothetical protein